MDVSTRASPAPRTIVPVKKQLEILQDYIEQKAEEKSKQYETPVIKMFKPEIKTPLTVNKKPI